MAFKIMLANTTELLDEAFKLRHKVFVEEERLLQATGDRRLFDRYDAYPTTSTFVLKQNDNTVGSIRLALDSSQGVPADEYFDFRLFLPPHSRLLHAGLICISRKYRSAELMTGLLLMSAYFADSHEVTHIVAPVNPRMSNLLRRIGFRKVGEQFFDSKSGVPMVPFVLDVKDVRRDHFLEFIHHNKLRDFLTDYQRWFFKAGDYICKAGSGDTEAFLIIKGTVQVIDPQNDELLDQLSEGELFGELAMLTGNERTADVVAITDVQVMVFFKEDLRDKYARQFRDSLEFMRRMGWRLMGMECSLMDRRSK